jgi:hypothetical protein
MQVGTRVRDENYNEGVITEISESGKGALVLWDGKSEASVVKLEEIGSIKDLAIMHILKQIRTRPEVQYFLGAATESFDLLSKAAAEITGKSVEEIAARYLVRPKSEPRWPVAECKECGYPMEPRCSNSTDDH